MEILRAGSETAKAAAAQTLDKMKHAMMIVAMPISAGKNDSA